MTKPKDEQEPETEEAPAVIEPDADEIERQARRARLLEGIPPDIAGLISDSELDKIEGEEKKRAEDERKKLALTSVREGLRQQARIENGLIAADVLRSEEERRRLREPVTFRVQLPNDGAGHRGQNGFRVDGVLYQQGHTYIRPRAVVESLQDTFYRAHRNEYQFRTLDQHKPGNSAAEALGRFAPRFVIAA